MPRLSFEEPKGGPLAKTAHVGKHAAPEDEVETEQAPEQDDATELFEQFTDEPEPEEDERRTGRDTVVVVLRAATVAAAIALVGFIILLATSGEDGSANNSPNVPNIPTSHDQSAAPTTSTPALGAIVAPPVHTQTTEIVPPPVTQPTIPTDTPPPGRDEDEFVRVGEPCDTPGAYAFTERFDPVVCDGGRHGERLTWRRIFR